MATASVKDRLPPPLVRVWVMTNTGRRTTAYLKRDGEWFLFCRKIAADKPEVVSWEDS